MRADLGDAGGDGAVGSGDRVAAEHQRRLGQPVADAVRSYRQRVGRNDTAAAESEGKQIGHAEQRAHLADLDDRVGFPRKAVAKLADIGRSAADIDDHRVLDAG